MVRIVKLVATGPVIECSLILCQYVSFEFLKKFCEIFHTDSHIKWSKSANISEINSTSIIRVLIWPNTKPSQII